MDYFEGKQIDNCSVDHLTNKRVGSAEDQKDADHEKLHDESGKVYSGLKVIEGNRTKMDSDNSEMDSKDKFVFVADN